MNKQAKWTKQCCRIVYVTDINEEFEYIGTRKIITKRNFITNEKVCGNYIPDEFDRCNDCLRGDYSEFSDARFDYCDHEGMGEQHINVDDVIKMIRRAEENGAPVLS